MHATDSLTDLERRTWRATFDDGLFDLVLGATLMIIGVSRLLPDDRWLYPLFFVVAGAFLVLKQRVVIPRTGVVRFAEPRQQRKLLSTVVLAASSLLGVVAMAVFMLDGDAARWIREHPRVMEAGFPVMVFVVFGALAHLLEVKRIYLIGLVFAACFWLTTLLHDTSVFLVGGALVMVPGIVLFTRFLRAYPLLEGDDQGGRRHD